MVVNIRSIHIENFRSIRSLDAPVSPLAVFVGKNDCGKSNILRALNLFFNDQTNHGTRFNFDEDYNFFAQERRRKAKEILVRIDIEIPSSYRRTNGDIIVWEKRWRKEGLVKGDANYHGARLDQNNRGRETREKVEIPEKSNVHALLRRIEYEYVPAVKGAKYFDDIRGRIYNTISEFATKSFRETSTTFEQSIGDHVEELTASINDALGFATKLALPRDLSHIFERLDFISGKNSVSLENRGDGIKARHIPLILRFMAEKKKELQKKGSPPSSFIWGYEEPENNLEFSNAIELADELVSLVGAEVAQILLTTHSPVFYDLAEKDETIHLHFVSRQTEIDGTKVTDDKSELDESLGTLALLNDRMTNLVEEVRQQTQKSIEAKRLLKEQKCKIFVEGQSDKVVLTKALEVFFPAFVEFVDFETKRRAGHTYVISMLNAWRANHKYEPEGPKAAGIVDSDAKTELHEFNKLNKNRKSAKCFCYPPPDHITEAHEAGFLLPVDLESLYSIDFWQWASENDHLEVRGRSEVFPKELIEQVLKGHVDPNEGMNEAWSILVQSKFKSESKIACANYIVTKNDDECRVELAPFELLLRDVLAYLGLVEEADAQ
ncbi:hypothetical protein MNBD_ALPHA12-1927 [hydrothermal vent metagenome]|uniref:Endonuclease GajA/Old nuclease/RecF-like AAA domain-containing protein n=1 Tax=hydrothermal vent metagenome TaxID=652676 RepID=A0A3B0TXN2_9ZZZZ